MKIIFRSAAIMLVLAQLFLISAAANDDVSTDVYEKMMAAAAGTAVTSGAADGRTADPVPEEKADAAS